MAIANEIIEGRVVVTGATSMIGVALIESCLKNGLEVLAIVRPNSTRLQRLPKSKNLVIEECSIDNYISFSSDIKYDILYHLGWVGTAPLARNDTFYQNKNIQNSLDAVSLAKRLGCNKFVGAGSQAEYGLSSGVLSPDSPVNPVSAYGIAKYAAGRLCSLCCKENDIEYNWARVFSVYGPNDNTGSLIDTLITSLYENKLPELTKCEQTWDYLYSTDAGEAFRLIGEKGKDQAIYCVGSGIAKPLREYVSVVAGLFGKNLSSQMGLVPYSQNQVMKLCADISSLRTDTGFCPKITFEDGVKKTIDIFLQIRSCFNK